MKILFALLFSSWSLAAATYYVDPVNGSDSNDGLATNTAWQTIGRAVPRFVGYGYRQAGDTVLLRGGLYVGDTNAIDLGNGLGTNGEPGQPITVKNYPGEVPIITDMVSWNSKVGYPINIKNKKFYTFEGLIYSNNYIGAAFSACTNFVLTNCVFTQMRPDAGVDPVSKELTNHSAACIIFSGSCQSNRVTHCVITNWGITCTNANSANQYYTRGSPIIWGDESITNEFTWYNLVESNVFARCGHDLMGATMGFMIYRGNLFYNDPFMPTNEAGGYLYYKDGNVRTEPNRLGKWGARIQKTGAGNNDFTGFGYLDSQGSSSRGDLRQLWEDNVLVYAALPVDSKDAAAFGICTRYGIYRRNIIAFNQGSGIYFQHSSHGYRPPVDTNNIAYYHSEMTEAPYGTNAPMVTFNAIYNNVIYGNGSMVSLSNGYNFPASGMVMVNGDSAILNNWIVNNIVWANWPDDINDSVYMYGPDFYGRSAGQIVKTNWVGGVGLDDPAFVSTNGAGWYYVATNMPDFRLQATSPCIDAGTWLTICTGTGNSSTLTVSNSCYFSDGMGMIPGDTIQLQGDTTVAVVMRNDWTNNVLYLDRALSWTNGQGVALRYYGSSPDMGAFESGESAIPKYIRGGTVRAGTVRKP